MNTNETTIKIEFSKDEALVLFEWLSNFDDLKNKPMMDDAEQKVLWNLEAKLEPLLVEIVKPEYKKLVIEAKERLKNYL
jgi:hypothetical protein